MTDCDALGVARIAPVLGHSDYTLVFFGCGCTGLLDPRGELTVAVLVGCRFAHSRHLDYAYQRGERDKFAD